MSIGWIAHGESRIRKNDGLFEVECFSNMGPYTKRFKTFDEAVNELKSYFNIKGDEK